MQHHTHTLGIFIDNNSKVLILGSFPSVKSRGDGFYYAHPRNRFYKVIGRCLDEECPSDLDKKKEYLRKHHIALYDVIEECDIHASSDSSIKNVKPIDIEKILLEHPDITSMGITGNKASKLFKRHLLDKVDKRIKIMYLPSTSPANARMSIDDLVKEYSLLFK